MLVNVIVFILLSFLISLPFKHFKYYQARFLSLIILSFFAYLLAHFMPYPEAFYLTLSFFLVLSLISIVRSLNSIPSLSRLFSSSGKDRWFDPSVEAVFLLVLSYFLFLRWLNPDIFGAEKFMDCAFISSVLHSSCLPPLDPFLAGYRLNCYYYFGHVIGASIALMSFLPVQYSYNLAISAIAAYSSSTLYGFLKDIGLKRAWAGVIFTLFTGDFAGFYYLLKDLFLYHRVSWLYYWNATRVIPGTINEFPYFSFLHADFHAHVVAIPLFILSLSILYTFFVSDSEQFTLTSSSYSAVLLVLSYVLYITNSWDSPVFLLLFFLMALIMRRKALLLFFGCVISTYLAYTTIHSASAKVHIVSTHSPLFPFLLYFLVPVLFAYCWIFKFSSSLNNPIYSIFLSAGVVVAAILTGVEILVVILPLAILSFMHLGLKSDLSHNVNSNAGLKNVEKREKFLLVLILVACLFTLFPEFFAIDCRMNTVFKFYEICWLLYCIPGSIVLDSAFEAVRVGNCYSSGNASLTVPIGRRRALILILLFLLTLTYPAVATPQKCSVKRCTLDGMAFTKYFGEYRALLWAQKHVKGIIMSAAYNCYTYGGRFPAFTGNPVVVGWACHEVQWRGNGKMLARRMLDVKLFYTDPGYYWKVLDKYNVSYVVLGYEEKKEFNANRKEFLPLLGKVLRIAYEDKNVVIYRVIRATDRNAGT